MQLKDKNILVVGLGASGLAAARLCLDQGARVKATDLNPSPDGAGELAAMGAKLILGRHEVNDFTSADLIVLSPGVNPAMPQAAEAARKGVEILGEMGLGYRLFKAPTVMITGSNGKSTVTSLIGEMLKAGGQKVFVGGNLGSPLCGFLASGQKADRAVLEVSSFQIDTGGALKPEVGVLMNITPDHLDRYGTFAAYAASKMRLFANQEGSDLAVLFADDPEVMKRAGSVPAGKCFFGQNGPHTPGGWLEDSRGIIIRTPDGEELRFGTAQSRLPGMVNRFNQTAAALAALACGISPKAVQQVIDGFPGLPHRMQFSGSIDGVDYYNDSKGTNLGAVAAALCSLDKPLTLLLGGRDKDSDFTELKSVLGGKVQKVVCFGEAGPSIHGQIKDFAPAVLAGSLKDAFNLARKEALSGQAVLLSPGCASFDEFRNYGHRGDYFMQLVKEAAVEQPS